MDQRAPSASDQRLAAPGRHLDHLLRGATAGMGATAVMTAGLLAQAAVTRGELEPKRITEWVLGRVGIELGEPALDLVTGVSHTAFGTAAGAVYGLLRARSHTPTRPAAQGVAYGIVVWASSYAGWVPALGIMPPPTRDTPGRATRIHISHWVYGATLGLVEAELAARHQRTAVPVTERARARHAGSGDRPADQDPRTLPGTC